MPVGPPPKAANQEGLRLMHPMPTPNDRPRGRSRRGPLVFVAALLILALPTIALASHQFSDVPTSNPFHSNITRLVDSGITAGCGSGRFCPKSNVTREQMAAFMGRGLGRAALGSGAIPIADAEAFYVGTVRIETGGASGGTGFVTVAADVGAVTDESGLCPCRAEVFLVDLANGAQSDHGIMPINDTGFADGTWAGNAAAHWVFSAPSNQARTYGLAVSVETTGTPPPTADTAVLFATLTAEYSAFGSAGGSTLGLSGTGGFTFGEPTPNDRTVAPEG